MTPDRVAVDRFTDDCVLCGRQAVELCVIGDRNRGVVRDFCAECIEAGRNDDNFGRCYFCRDFHDHEHCIGVPCQCSCPAPEVRERLAAREAVLAKLTATERAVLGF